MPEKRENGLQHKVIICTVSFLNIGGGRSRELKQVKNVAFHTVWTQCDPIDSRRKSVTHKVAKAENKLHICIMFGNLALQLNL